ncbi:MAG: protein-L-isoaspartate(D-aspartate) O-methyltransferase [Phycisphaerales bacterium]|nr:MAG: protein-L-isoaspartate(D-aspartate) O-methyltransferase [Phycisphaerales bacterium]
MVKFQLVDRGIRDPHVLEAMAKVPRHRSVDAALWTRAYADRPLPIGAGQTISQPYIVALMTQLLRLDAGRDVLEIGTGSGYQTAILARLARMVYTMEALQDLADRAQEVLQNLEIGNVEFRLGDGSCGWPERRTFERIVVTAAAPDWPGPLLDQLDEGGRIVAPLGRGPMQSLMVGEKRRGKLIESHICACRFVKLVGQYGFPEH